MKISKSLILASFMSLLVSTAYTAHEEKTAVTSRASVHTQNRQTMTWEEIDRLETSDQKLANQLLLAKIEAEVEHPQTMSWEAIDRLERVPGQQERASQLLLVKNKAQTHNH